MGVIREITFGGRRMQLVATSTSWRRGAGAVCLVLAAAAGGGVARAGPADADATATFQQYCFQCHGEAAAMAGINLKELTAEPSFSNKFPQWRKVIAALEQKQMPPENLPRPSEAERRQAAGWIRSELDAFVKRHADDPGPVTVRRLTSAEYAYTVRDLTGLGLNVDRDFATDAVGGEGFTNFGDVQFMADANLERYLAAAKRIADHAVIGAGPLEFFTHPGQSGFELSAIHRIHEIYRAHGFRAVSAEGGLPFGLERYGKAFYAAWRYKHRKALGEAGAGLSELAEREGISPRFADHIWSAVNRENVDFPMSEVVSRWRNLPPPEAAEADVREACSEIQEYVIYWPRWLFGASVSRQATGGAGDERSLAINDTSVSASRTHEFTYLRRGRLENEDPDQDPGSVYFSVESANPDSTDQPTLVWRNARVTVQDRDRGDLPERPLRKLLSDEEAAAFRFGVHPDGKTQIGPNDFATVGEVEGLFHVPVPENSRNFTLKVSVEADLTGSDAVLRVIMLDSKRDTRGRPESALLADPTSPGFKTWKSQVLDYAAQYPASSHGEPTPADRDPIPPPFDNTYNQPERDRFHFRVKYFRDDEFLTGKMLDDATREKLEQAWSDLKASFEYHDAILDFVDDKYSLDLDDKGIADLSKPEIESLPPEPRGYATALRGEHDAVHAKQMAAHPGHIEDCIKFASRAWRRPISAEEKDTLRKFYTEARERLDLDHTKAIRALLTRILVSPAFLYRLETPDSPAGPARLSDWEIASRLSYFLWSSPPDGELRRVAQAGELADPARLERQVKRMLAGPKARRFAAEFFGQWLGFYRFDQHRGVDTTRFPKFTDEVKSSMLDEAVSFFEHIVREERPVREILSADYAFLNRTLAEHYGIEERVDATEKVERVNGANAFQRGGMMRLGAILTATSAPLRTSPVKRGDWILRRVLGTPTPTPPADAGSIPADERLFGGLTVREQLESHRSNPSCASCHTRIDPLGFSLEHYDSIGRWREQYSNGKPIDDSGTLADQTEIAGIHGILRYLENHEQQVLRNLSNKLVGYALGRTVLASDQQLIDRLTELGGDATFSQLAATIVTSKQFRYHRGQGEASVAADPNPVREARRVLLAKER